LKLERLFEGGVKMKKIRTGYLQSFDEFLQESFKEKPEKITLYLEESLNDYKKDKDISMLISSIRDVVKAKGFCYIAKKIGLSKQALYKALSLKNPHFSTTLEKIIDIFGYKIKFNFDYEKIA
jgi:probable addiction module antidote protein